MDSAPKLWHREEEELQTVLSSDLFARAPSLAMLLGYICRKRFAGEDHLIKEYNIAVEALGRPADFDQKRDSIVRVEAHRLRKRLKEYYQREGTAHQIEIEIPSRGYAPVFKDRSASTEPGPSDPAVGTVEANGKDRLWDDLGFPGPAETPAATVASSTTSVRRPAGWQRIAMALGVVSVLVVVVAWAKLRNQPPPPVVPPAVPAAASANTPGAGDSVSEVRISCGSTKEFVDKEGHLWMADRYFQGGTARSVTTAEFEGTQNPQLFRTWREGSFTYKIPLKQGHYELTLAMAEPAPAAGQPAPVETERLFDVLVNGKVALNEYDLFADAGALSLPDWKVFRDIQPDASGFLVIEMRNRVSGAVLNGITVTPGSPGRLRPIRVGMRERPYTDVTGRLWVEDRYYSGGKLVKRIENITGTEDPEIYRNERYGRLKYTIPVPADSTYTLIFHFAETWFGGSGKGGVGSRLFDVLCNGQMLMSNVDIYREAGGPFRALTRAFRGIKPRENGKIVLEMIPSRNYACLNALEVLDESPGEGRPQPKQTTKR